MKGRYRYEGGGTWSDSWLDEPDPVLPAPVPPVRVETLSELLADVFAERDPLAKWWREDDGRRAG